MGGGLEKNPGFGGRSHRGTEITERIDQVAKGLLPRKVAIDYFSPRWKISVCSVSLWLKPFLVRRVG